MEYTGTATRLYLNPPGQYVNPAYLLQEPGASDSATGVGRRRVAFTVERNNYTRWQNDNWALVREPTNPAGALGTPITAMAIGRRSRFSDQPVTNATIHRAMWANAALPDDHLRVIGRTADSRPIHMIGDSFLNNQVLLGRLAERQRARGVYIPISQDGVGGISLTDHLEHWIANTKTVSGVTYDLSHWKKSTLIIMDGGRSDTVAQTIAAVNTMIELLNGHTQWLYVQSGITRTLDAAGVTAYLAEEAELAAEFGSHYVETYAFMRTNGTGSTTGPNGGEVWPLDSCVSSTDFHPSTAQGHPLLAQCIDAALLALNYTA